MAACELLDRCGFFLKYQDSLNLACRGFIRLYCNGELIAECARKKYRQQHGTPPADDMMPTGQAVPMDAR